MFIFETQRKQFQSFKNVDHLNETLRAYLYKFKKELHDQNTFCKELNATGKVFKAIYTHSVASAYGVSYLSNKTISSLTGVCTRSVRRATKRLVELGIILKIATKRKNGSNTTNTIAIRPLLSSAIDSLFKVPKQPCPPTLSQLESESFNHALKQGKDNNISNLKIDELSFVEKIKVYAGYVAEDYIKNNRKIDHISAFTNKLLKNLQKKAIYQEEIVPLMAKREQESQKRINDFRSVLFDDNGKLYNWLES